MTIRECINEAVSIIQPNLSHQPDIAIILGSGLGNLANHINEEYSLPFVDMPHCEKAGAFGHVGRLVLGELGGQQVACMQGRLHTYEGYMPEQVVFPLRVMHALGARTLIVTNAAGGINKHYNVGDIMLICDHINFAGGNPLTLGADQDSVAFPDMSNAYSLALLVKAFKAAATCNLTLQQGVYLGVRGPNFETPAEIRAFRTWGADAVGMSTVYEVLTAASLGMDVLGLSLIANKAAGMHKKPITSEDVMETTNRVARDIGRLLLEILATWNEESK
ncbi:MAG: purine-nucleoside phosphorylase [Coriobacteriia bacterium]|nr:purine-nucleoside phosphorylase [Coriobacteriia bacterium]